MSLTVSILFGLILVLLIVIVFYNKIIRLAMFLSRILGLGLFSQGESHTALNSIFYLYNHPDIKSWQQWISKQDAQTQREAISMIMKHLYGKPGTWGLLSPIAIESLVLLSRKGKEDSRVKDLIDELSGVFNICKRVWDKFIIAEKMYQSTWKTLIKLDEKAAMQLIKKELNSNLKNNAEINISLVSSFTSFDTKTDISELFCTILTDLKESFKVKKEVLTIMDETRDEEENFKTITSTLNRLAQICREQPSDDDNKMLTKLLDIASKNLDDDIIKLILKICQNEYLGLSCIKSLETIISNNPNSFDPKALYSLISIKNTEIIRIIKVLARIFNLNPAEIQLCSQGPSDFKTSLFANEKIQDLNVTEESQTLYKEFKATIKDSKKPGLPLLTGTAEKDKIYFARAFAAENNLSFLYAQYSDIASSELTFDNLLEKIQEHKPLVLYLAEVGPLLESGDTSFFNRIKKIINDARVTVVASTEKEGSDATIPVTLKMKFGQQVFRLNEITLKDQAKIFKGKLDKIQQKNKSGSFDMEEIINSLSNRSRLDFEIDLIHYLKSGLLTEGKVIELKQFEELIATAEEIKKEA